MAVANSLFTALAFISSPLSAHALGPTGRGKLAAVLVPLVWGVSLTNFGLPTYATRAVARERGSNVGAIVGTLGAACLVLGLLGIVAGIPIAGVLAGHDEFVRKWIIIGLFLLPAGLIAGLGLGIANGLEAWTRLSLMRILPPLLTVVAYIVLFALGKLTVTAAIVVTYSATLISLVPLLGIVRARLPLSVDFGLLRRATAFGARAWVGTLASNANNRLDQLLMIPLVTPSQLGLYAVAVNVSALDAFPVAALSTVIGPSVARGDHALLARAVRVTMFADMLFGITFALVARWVMPIAFGTKFNAALPMTYVLLAASVPGAGAWVLSVGLQNAGHPEIPALGELVALAVTVVGLILLLPPLAGMGAAISSGAAYTTSCSLQVGYARFRLGIPLTELLIVRRSDLRYVFTVARQRIRPNAR